MFASATTAATTTTRVLLSSSSSSSSSKRRMHHSTPQSAAVSDDNNDNDEKISTTKNNARRLTIATTTAAFLSLTSLASSSVHAAVECNLITPCTNPPPNGEPRYILPGSQYDPAKAAEEAYVRALEAKKSKVTTETTLSAPAVEITKTD